MKKILDHKGRWRNKMVGVRLSQEEASQLDKCVKLSGLTKQNYIIDKLLDKEIIVHANTRVYKSLRNELLDVHSELERLCTGEVIGEELDLSIRLMAEMLSDMKGDYE